jgi:hypothetical protein
MRLPDLIEEIKSLKTSPSHKSTMDICRMLENNRRLFLQKIEEENFKSVLTNFENLSSVRPVEYNTSSYNRDYEHAHSLLSFYFDRII